MTAIDVIAGLQDPTTLDSAARTWVLAHQSRPAVTAMSWVSTLGSVTPMALLAVAGALVMWWRERRHVVPALLLAPLAAVLTSHFVKRFVARSRPQGLGHTVEGTYSFPSAHATTAAAVCLTLAYVFWRERLVTGAVALPIAVFVPLLVGVSRIYLDEHWATDVIGGWSLGLLIAALCAALYHQSPIGARPSSREDHERTA
jgi:undecaprenyl-diphosphatase